MTDPLYPLIREHAAEAGLDLQMGTTHIGGPGLSERERLADLYRWADDPAIPDEEWAPVRVTTMRAIAREREWLLKAAKFALTPDGSHTLIDGYCRDCAGGCLRFDPEPIPYAEPTPFGGS